MSKDRYSVYVGRLSSRTTRNELQEEFERFGTIKDIDLRRSHAFVEFGTSEEARAGVEGMDGVKIHGERIVCQRKGDRIKMMNIMCE
jgi:arginine/serine-rich splicing factor 7